MDTSFRERYFQTRKWNYTQHEWSLVTFKTVSKNWKYPVVEEAQGSTSHNKQRKEQRDSNILFYNPWVFKIFELVPAIIMQYLYDSVEYALKVWVSFTGCVCYILLVCFKGYTKALVKLGKIFFILLQKLFLFLRKSYSKVLHIQI